MSNVLNYYGNIGLELSKCNVFIGKNGTGKSNLAKTIFQLVTIPSNIIPPLTPFRGNQTTESRIEMSIEFDKVDLESFKSSSSFQYLANSRRLASLPLLIGLLELSNINIIRRISQGGTLFEIESFPIPSDHLQIDIYNQFNLSLSNELRKEATFIPDTRDLPGSFGYDRNFEGNPVTIDNFLTFLTDMKLNHRESYDKLVEMYRRIVPYVKDLNINPAGNVLTLVEEVDEFKIPTLSISKGTRELIVVLAVLALCSNGTSVFIEEPEIHLHPSAIVELKKVIQETAKSKDLQITIITHSPIFLSGLEPELDKDVQVYLFSREKNGESTVEHIIKDSDFDNAQNSLDFDY